jgi:uncharacterized protein (TIGR02145 family)
MKASFHKFTAALLAACLFTLFACSGDDGGENKPPEQNVLCEFDAYDGYGYDCFETEKELCNRYGKTVSYCRTPSIIYGVDLIDSRDGNRYKTVVIGSQTWMAENLNYDVGEDDIFSIVDCYDCDKYGRLYDWETAMKVCPKGWHLPTNEEWETLIKYVGGTRCYDPYVFSQVCSDINYAGRKLKARNGWNEGGDGTDDYGFSALPGGDGSSLLPLDDDEYRDGAGKYGKWWSADERVIDNDLAYSYLMYHSSEQFSMYLWSNKDSRSSIRCLQD